MKESTSRELELRSSAVTLSDMEMFIFPELMYSLVLANIMSPRIWKWRDDPWFAGLEQMKPYRRITRLKQYIMDHYVFNLDLDTWGLTTKERELARFQEFIDESTLAQSNALFGYEGDKYYFDIDIRTHFGLDKYEGSIIPYWKTETVEAMDAFCHKPDYDTGAGECVSLATLYAAALFVVARIPLRDIYLMATPLHSQNLVDIDDGILTNNRRLVTKNMWFNGTELSAQARRALENERVTIVAHESGYIHAVYDETTIDSDAYDQFGNRLAGFLKTRLTPEILGNFLRSVSSLQKCFQVSYTCHGHDHFIAAERVFAYEHSSPYKITDNTRAKLLAEIDSEELQRDPLCGRIVLNDLEDFVKSNGIDLDNPEHLSQLNAQFESGCLNRQQVVEGLVKFCHVRPRLPDAATKHRAGGQEPLGLDNDMTRKEVCDRLESIRESNQMADMAFYAYRDLTRTEPGPFLLASVQRNPVSLAATSDMDLDAIAAALAGMPSESIYDDAGRLAQPDEVWNFGRGDGLEKAVLLASAARRSMPDETITVEISSTRAIVKAGSSEHSFETNKGLADQEWNIP
jgi:hypothetical protein